MRLRQLLHIMAQHRRRKCTADERSDAGFSDDLPAALVSAVSAKEQDQQQHKRYSANDHIDKSDLSTRQ